jgi:dUTP pyrophosphatase
MYHYMPTTVVFERLERPQHLHESFPWTPVMPSYDNDLGNAGIDLASAATVVAEEVGASSRLPYGYFEITGSDMNQDDMQTLARALTDMDASVDVSFMGDLARKNVRMEYSSNSPKPLRMYQAVIRTGLRVALPTGFHMKIASRSGLGFKRNILAFPGIIDNSYRGELMIKLYQLTSDESPFIIEAGERIAQGILFSTPEIFIREGEVSTSTLRGENGFGSTGA